MPPGLVEFFHYVENPERQDWEIQDDERVRKLAGQIEISLFSWKTKFEEIIKWTLD